MIIDMLLKSLGYLNSKRWNYLNYFYHDYRLPVQIIKNINRTRKKFRNQQKFERIKRLRCSLFDYCMLHAAHVISNFRFRARNYQKTPQITRPENFQSVKKKIIAWKKMFEKLKKRTQAIVNYSPLRGLEENSSRSIYPLDFFSLLHEQKLRIERKWD